MRFVEDYGEDEMRESQHGKEKDKGKQTEREKRDLFFFFSFFFVQRWMKRKGKEE